VRNNYNIADWTNIILRFYIRTITAVLSGFLSEKILLTQPLHIGNPRNNIVPY